MTTFKSRPRSHTNTALLLPRVMAKNSASAVDKATVDCVTLPVLRRCEPNKTA